MKVCVVLLFIFLTSATVASDEHWIDHNGEWWLAQTPRDKLSFLEGYIVAKNDTQISLERFKRSGQDFGKDALRMVELELESSDFYRLSMGQLSDGLDQFYRDYRNKMVDFSNAVGYVKHEIRGRPQEQLHRELILIRCEATSPNDPWGCVKTNMAKP